MYYINSQKEGRSVNLIRGTLMVITVLALGLLIQTLVTFISQLYKHKRYGEPIAISPQKGRPLRITILVIGLLFTIGYFCYPSPGIGNLFERSDAQHEYEAYIYGTGAGETDEQIFCIVSLSKRGGEYSVHYIQLPYGYDKSIDDEYKPNSEENYISLGEWDYRLELLCVATADSLDRLEKEVVTNYGHYCGSKNSDKYHELDCTRVKNIAPENLVLFRSESEANALGYSFCRECYHY